MNVLASPWIPLGPAGRWGGRGLELSKIETGGVAGGHFERYVDEFGLNARRKRYQGQ
jgi:hypothetical protein